MIKPVFSSSFEQGVEPLVAMLLPGKEADVLNYRPDPAIQARIEELADKCTEGELTEVEREEYEGYVQANNFIGILQRQARRRLDSDPRDS